MAAVLRELSDFELALKLLQHDGGSCDNNSRINNANSTAAVVLQPLRHHILGIIRSRGIVERSWGTVANGKLLDSR